MFRNTIFALALGLALCTQVQARDAVPPIIYAQRILPNGLKVFTSVDRATPNVTVQVWYGVGSKDDPVGRSGFAHLFEHMMFKATRNLPAESMDRFTEDVGGLNNASTYDDFTNYYAVVPANHLERLIWVESERLGSLVVDEANFKSERDVVKEELRQRVLADPYGRLFSLYLPKATYRVHPYKRPGIGSIEELDAATVDDVQAFHQTHYRPDNAALIVVGNFDDAKLQAWIDKYLAPLKNPDTPRPQVTVVEPERTGAGVYQAYGPNVPLPAVALTWLGPKAADSDAPALAVLDAILSSGKSSRLYNSLVYRQQISAQAFSIADLPQQPGMFVVGSIMASGHSLEEGERALLAEVKKLREAPPKSSELLEAKNELITAKLRERETIEGRAFAIGYALSTEGDPARANQDLARLQAVTGADVRRVARRYLAEDRRMTLRYRAESERPKGESSNDDPVPVVASVKYSGPISALAAAGHRQAPPALGVSVAPVLPIPAEKTLANGLRVVVAKSSDLPLVTADLTIKVGAWADPEGLAGAASMTAGMLTEGTTTKTAPQIAAATEALGATLESSGSQDSASISLNVMPSNLAAAMAIMADVAQNPAFAPEELERQRAKSLDGLSVSYEQPGALAGFAVGPVLFAGTAFGHAPDGTPNSLARLAVADLAKLHHRYYRPDNTVLVLTGDISPDKGFALAEKLFGSWKTPSEKKPTQPMISPTASPRAIAIDLPGTGQAAVTVVKVGIPRDDRDYYPGIVANSVLGGGYSARLNAEIRVKRGLSYGSNSSLSTRRTTGTFRAQAQTKNESAAEVLDLILEQLNRMAADQPGVEELQARKSNLIGNYGRNLATTEGLASTLGNLALYDVPLAEMNAYAAKVEAISAEQVQEFAKQHFDTTAVTLVVAGDASVFAEKLRQRATNLEVIPAKEIDFDRQSLREAK